MEQKLAEFRARRQAENAAKRTKCPDVPTEVTKARGITCEREGAAESADSNSSSSERPGRQVRTHNYVTK